MASFAADSGVVAAAPIVEVFTREGCPHCAAARRHLDALEGERPGLVVVEHDVDREPGARERLRALSARAGVVTPGVPTFVVRDSVLVGFDPATTPAALERLLDSGVGDGRAGPSAGAGGVADLPVFGHVDVDRVGLPLFTIAIGLVDGFNPCATWVLLFLLAMLVNLRSRAHMALIAGTFVVTSGVVYFAFMAAWLTVFMVIGISDWVRVVLALFAILVGLLNTKDFVAMGRGPSLGIPASAKPGIYARVRAVLHADDLAGALVGIVALAFLVNLVELLCTAGLPALYTAILTSRELSPARYYGYLGLYVLAYMLDDSVLVTIAVVTLGKRKLHERGARWLKLLSGLVILALGALLLIRPRWLGF